MLLFHLCTCWALRLAHADSGDLDAFDTSSAHCLMTLKLVLKVQGLGDRLGHSKASTPTLS